KFKIWTAVPHQEEGWPRHQEEAAKPRLNGADGVVWVVTRAFDNSFSVLDRLSSALRFRAPIADELMCFLRGSPCLRETFLCLTQLFLLRPDLGVCFFECLRGGIRKSSGLPQRLLGSLQGGSRRSRRRGINGRNQSGERLEPQWTDVVREASRHRSPCERRRGRQRFKRCLDAT